MGIYLNVFVPTMSIQDLDSSMIQRIDYDSITSLLRVTFRNQSIYEYQSVPIIVFTRLRTISENQESIGKGFNDLVKSAGFEYRKVN